MGSHANQIKYGSFGDFPTNLDSQKIPKIKHSVKPLKWGGGGGLNFHLKILHTFFMLCTVVDCFIVS